LSRSMLGLLGLYVATVLLFSRDLVGRSFSILLASYHFETFALIGLLAVVVGCRREAGRVR